MAGVFVGTYSIRIHPKWDATPCLLKFDSKATARGVILAALDQLQTCRDNKDDKQLLRVVSLASNATDIWGFIERGEYGYSADIVSQRTLKQSYQKNKDEAEMRRFYFRFHLPDGSDAGILVLQRFGVHGIYTDLRNALEASFRAAHEDFRLTMARRVQAAVFQQMLSGRVRSYRVTTYSIPTDLADFVKFKGAKKHLGTFEVAIQAGRGRSLWTDDAEPAWYKAIMTGSKTVAEIWPDGVRAVKVSVEYGGRWRMVDLSEPDEIMPYTDVTNSVTMTDGHPDMESMNAVCVSIYDELLKELSPQGETS